jgi:hypothetical protein
MPFPRVRIALTAGAALLVLAQEAGAAIPATESFWPNTIVGWLTAVGLVITIAASGYGFHRFSQREALERVAKLRLDTERELTRYRADAEERLNAFHTTIRAEINGWGSRIEILKEETVHSRALVDALTRQMIETRRDWEHMSGMLRRFGEEFDDYRREQREREDRLMDAIEKIRDRPGRP